MTKIIHLFHVFIHNFLSDTATHEAVRNHIERFIQMADEDSMVNDSLEAFVRTCDRLQGQTNAAVASALHSFGNYWSHAIITIHFEFKLAIIIRGVNASTPK